MKLLIITLLLVCMASGQDTLSLKGAGDKYYYKQGILNVGYSYQPSASLSFYGTNNANDKPQMIIKFGDTIYIKTTVPVDKAGRLIIDWTNQYYDWYVDSLKKEIVRLKKIISSRRTPNQIR